MPHILAAQAAKKSRAIEAIEEDLCNVASTWFSCSPGDITREMNRLEMREKIKEEYKEMLVRLTERMH